MPRLVFDNDGEHAIMARRAAQLRATRFLISLLSMQRERAASPPLDFFEIACFAYDVSFILAYIFIYLDSFQECHFTATSQSL